MTGINKSEFEKVFMDWYYPVRNFIYYKTGEMEAAEDIVQDTFLKLWEKRDEIKLETVKSLIYTIANNLFLNRVERGKVVLKFNSEYDPGVYSSSPDYELEMKEFDNRLQESIASLDEKNRVVFLMNRIDKLTYNEIAERLGLSVKAVEKRMGKALSFLKERLEVRV